jgi:Cdc6-like AAA superfamily ATPase
MSMTPEERQKLGIEAGRVFSPAAPIDEKDLFAGRIKQLRRVIDVVNQRGQHAIIFGERGVGKTSLANVISSYLSSIPTLPILAPHVNCDGTDDFTRLWKKILSQIELSSQAKQAGFVSVAKIATTNLSDTLPTKVTPEDIRKALTAVSQYAMLIVIIDEFDRLQGAHIQRVFADTIKSLSDNSVKATIVLVGVADAVSDLIKEHQSVERALVQIRMQRMSTDELREIINKGLGRLGMTIDGDAIKHISLISQGLPHYTHLLGLYASREAIDQNTKTISMSHVQIAVKNALEGAQQTIRSAYHKATTSPRRDNLYADVLLACALAKTDDLGYFAAADVRTPLTKIKKRTFDIPSFSRHLNDFSEEKRGPILKKFGSKHKYRFRFINPLMQPFVTMQGFACGKIDRTTLEQWAIASVESHKSASI